MITDHLTCGERKICRTMKGSQSITKMIVDTRVYSAECFPNTAVQSGLTVQIV